MPRLATAVLAVAALLFAAGCGGGKNPVEGQTTPANVSTTPTTPGPGPAGTTTTNPPKAPDAKAQAARLRACVGGEPAETYKWFQPVVDYAQSVGGDGFTATLDGKPVTLVTFPVTRAAQLAYQNVTDRLILLQQRRPTDYATVSATASQVVGNVLEVTTQGALSAEASQTVLSCVTTTAKA
ncbi:hypothetical protein [Capillimicrobium parvum]|uniref:Lipoprotein n=1 Tax=Capillimicrobium parvum TaxID=2884022 RepID=A0A9E6Y2F7_9ACTN|nr:hypothetical protein [Capillimicrobium parvum]UGS38643.1 hypothetical protein DSM104329_05073 [Capillimicrobium parvum]